MVKRVMSEADYAEYQAKRGRSGVAVAQLVEPRIVIPMVEGSNPSGHPKTPAKRSKHGNIRTVRRGITFDSKHEADVYDDLLLREKAGEIRYLQRQVSFPLEVKGNRIQRWRCDFWYWEYDSGAEALWNIVVADAKSEHTANLSAWKRTRALFESLYGITVTIL